MCHDVICTYVSMHLLHPSGNHLAERSISSMILSVRGVSVTKQTVQKRRNRQSAVLLCWRHYVTDTQASTIFVPQDLFPQVAPLLLNGERDAPDAEGLRHAIIVTYSDYLECETDLPVPAFVSELCKLFEDSGCVAWIDALSASHRPTPMTGGPDDMAVMPYTSGTTGLPKGCVHNPP